MGMRIQRPTSLVGQVVGGYRLAHVIGAGAGVGRGGLDEEPRGARAIQWAG